MQNVRPSLQSCYHPQLIRLGTSHYNYTASTFYSLTILQSVQQPEMCVLVLIKSIRTEVIRISDNWAIPNKLCPPRVEKGGILDILLRVIACNSGTQMRVRDSSATRIFF